ncbi:hypothetical protein ACFX58_17185 [Sphingomonas sp. NCPPB 2930]
MTDRYQTTGSQSAFGAIHAGFSGDYGAMEQFVAQAMAAGAAGLSGPA